LAGEEIEVPTQI